MLTLREAREQRRTGTAALAIVLLVVGIVLGAFGAAEYGRAGARTSDIVRVRFAGFGPVEHSFVRPGHDVRWSSGAVVNAFPFFYEFLDVDPAGRRPRSEPVVGAGRIAGGVVGLGALLLVVAALAFLWLVVTAPPDSKRRMAWITDALRPRWRRIGWTLVGVGGTSVSIALVRWVVALSSAGSGASELPFVSWQVWLGTFGMITWPGVVMLALDHYTQPRDVVRPRPILAVS